MPDVVPDDYSVCYKTNDLTKTLYILSLMRSLLLFFQNSMVFLFPPPPVKTLTTNFYFLLITHIYIDSNM